MKHMKGVFEGLYEPFDQAFMRVPLLPVNTMLMDGDVEMILQDPRVCEALLIASPSLIGTLQSGSGKKVAQLQRRLLRYVNRMSSRTTPFGLFAGVAQLPVDRITDLSLKAPEEHRHRTRFDMEWLMAFVQRLERDPAVRAELIYMHTATLIRIGDRYYFERQKEKSQPVITSLAATAALEELIRKTRRGIRNADLLNHMLAVIPEASPETMRAFIDDCIERGLIYSVLRPPLTCSDPTVYIVKQLSRVPVACYAASELRLLQQCMHRYDACAIGKGNTRLRSCVASAEAICVLPERRLPFTVDCTLQFTRSPKVGRSIAADAAKLAELLVRLSPQTASPLAAYTKAFISKYGRNRRVPILEVVNGVSGIGIPERYAGDPFPSHNEEGTRDRNTLLLRMAVEAIRDKKTVVLLNDDMLGALMSDTEGLARAPETLDIAVQVVATSQGAVNEGDYLLVSSPLVGAQAAGNTAGRFADMLGRETLAYLRTIKTRRAGNASLHAELVYMPARAHAANIAIRPALQPFEIAVDVAPGVAATQTLSLNDLFLGVQGEQLYVWSKRRQKQVIIHAGHMLTSKSAPSTCRLLIHISRSVSHQLHSFFWGTAARLPFLPRLQYGRLVLSLATWTLDIAMLAEMQREPKEWRERLARWREEWLVPRFVYVRKRDNRLLLDLEKSEHAAELLALSREHGHLHELYLHEALPAADQAWVTSPEGCHMHEFVFQLKRKPGAPDIVIDKKVSDSVDDSQRYRGLVDGWLYSKLYLPVEQEDEFLALYIVPFVRLLTSHNAVGTWFFVRYSDPDHHIRLRFRANADIVLQRLVPQFAAWAQLLQKAGILQRYVIDSYDREIERYGGLRAIAIAEMVFSAESSTDVQLIELVERGTIQETVQVAAVTTHAIFNAFGFTVAEQTAWAENRMTKGAYREEYRRDREAVLSLLYAYKRDTTNPALNVCEDLEKALRPFGQLYRKLENEGSLSVPLLQIMSSFIHMHCNRLLGLGRPKEQQLITYFGRALSDLPKWAAGRNRDKT